MKWPKLSILAVTSFVAIALAVPPACETPIGPADLLTQPRILAIRSTPPDLVPQSPLVAAGQVTLDALLYLPPGSPAPTYTWSWCAAVNATLECATTAAQLLAIVDPGGGSGLSINYALGSSPTAVFSYPVSPALIESVCIRRPSGDAGADDGGVSLDDAALADGAPPPVGLPCAENSWPVAILLTVSVGTTTLQAERSLTVYLTTPDTENTNPTILGLSPFSLADARDAGPLANPDEESDGGLEDAGIAGVADGAVVMGAIVPATATDLYVGSVGGSFFPSADAAIEDAGPCIPEEGGFEEDGGPVCEPAPSQEVYEALDIAWYVGGGSLAATTTSMPGVANGAAQDWSAVLLNRWTPPAQAGSYPIILVARDNRGGVGWLVTSATVPVE
jgi:hypothetical protein